MKKLNKTLYPGHCSSCNDDIPAGVSAWSLVPLSQVIHSVEGGVNSTASDGLWQILGSATDATSDVTYAVGYRGDPKHRYLRLVVSVSGAPSAMWLGALAILGKPSDWPVKVYLYPRYC